MSDQAGFRNTPLWSGGWIGRSQDSTYSSGEHLAVLKNQPDRGVVGLRFHSNGSSKENSLVASDLVLGMDSTRIEVLDRNWWALTYRDLEPYRSLIGCRSR